MSAEIDEFIDQKVRELGEHFDTVQVLCGNFDPQSGTSYCYRGYGNWFTRLGLARDFIEREQNHSLAREVIRQSREED